MIVTLSPSFLIIASFISLACGQAKPMGFPFVIQEHKTIVSAPLLTISAALVTAFLPGHPPQVLNPIISISPSTPSNAHFFL